MIHIRPIDVLVVGVLAALVVYWLAEQYAEVLGEHVSGGAVPTWDYLREQLAVDRLAMIGLKDLVLIHLH